VVGVVTVVGVVVVGDVVGVVVVVGVEVGVVRQSRWVLRAFTACAASRTWSSSQKSTFLVASRPIKLKVSA
jgi:hypothetical protein